MNIIDIEQSFVATMIIVAVSLIALVAVLSAWAVQFFASNRQVRVAQHLPVLSYYRGLALGH